MKINTISLKNFRNYNQCEVPLNSRINLFLGANGQGKTSLLEAIWFSINGKSYRTPNAKNIISFSKKSAELRIRTTYRNSINEIKILIDENKKKILVNDKKIKNRAELKKILSTVLIDKEFKHSLEDSFRPRRISLDSIISNISPNFSKKLKLYSRELKRKNEVLANKGSGEVLKFINDRIVNLAHDTSSERKLWLDRINNIADKVLKKLIPASSLKCDIESECLVLDKLKEILDSNLEKESIIGKSIIGSHKDKISFTLNNYDVFEFGSEGEKKSVSMALKISEILLLKKINNEFPIILVDEIGSEFDKERFNFFYNFIASLDTQSFITANNKSILDINKKLDFTVFSIINGDCKKIS